LKRVVIDVGSSHFWDITGINALDRVVLKFRHHDIPVEIVGLNEASASLVEKLGTHNKEGVGLASGH
jgi:SulP family sulfate permease